MIVDAGPLYAYADRDDAWHDACLELLQTHPGPLLVPTLAITEAAYLIETCLGYEALVRFLADFAAGSFIAEPVHASDWLRIAELVGEYRDLPLGAVDASVIAAAERLGVSAIATVDRRDFTVVHTHLEPLVLLP